MVQIEKHRIIINNKLYDITEFKTEHPGGDEVFGDPNKLTDFTEKI